MDFSWRDGKLRCGVSPDRCPAGFTCDEGYCISGEGNGTDTSDSDTNEPPDGDAGSHKDGAPDGDAGSPCAVDADCPSAGPCDSPRCIVNQDGDHECVSISDSRLCSETGDVCQGDPDFECDTGSCSGGETTEEQHVTAGGVTQAGVSYFPSVAGLDDGFAVVWIDELNEYDYGSLFFARFDTTGTLVKSSVRIPKLQGWAVNYPRLLYLGNENNLAVVCQGWKNEVTAANEILVIFLTQTGKLSGSPVLVSANDGASSQWPDGAHHATTNQIGIVWSDRRDNSNHPEAYGAVLRVQSRSLTAEGNKRLSETGGDEEWVKIAAVSDGFVTAMLNKGTQEISTRFMAPSGALSDESNIVAPSGTATKPIALTASMADRVGLAWRDIQAMGPDSPVISFRQLDNHGAIRATGDTIIRVGEGLDDETWLSFRYPFNYAGGIALDWNETEAVFVIAWDTVYTTYSGDPNEAEIYLTRVVDDGSAIEYPWRVSNESHRSAMPRIAWHDGLTLISWHDNRDFVAEETWDGEIYTATHGCR